MTLLKFKWPPEFIIQPTETTVATRATLQPTRIRVPIKAHETAY
jgi:hypothetical protein